MEQHRKIGYKEALEAVFERIREKPSLISGEVRTFDSNENATWQGVLQPGLFQEDNWYLMNTSRPKKTGEDGEFFGGTDMVVRKFENEQWTDYGHHLVVTVTSEFGEITDIVFEVRW